MKLVLENIEGDIYIGFNELGSYLFYNRTISSTWNSCYGTLAKFLCTANSNEIDIRSIETIQSNLYNIYTNKIEDLKEVLNPILKKLRSGTYDLGFVHGDKWIINPESRKPNWNIYLHPRDFKPSTGLNLAFNYYDNLDYRFISTENEESINLETIAKYETEIQKGKRPFAIVMSSFYQPESDQSYPYEELGGYDADWNSENFILDGHHKLLAYKNLGILPNFAIIYQRYSKMTDTYFNYDEFSSILNSEQKRHFLGNWKSENKYSNGKRVNY